MTSITIKEYTTRDGSPFNQKDAAKIGPVLYEMSKERGVTARDVVDAARSTNSPLHDYFEWNDQKAADEYRLWRARDMLGSIKVRYIENDEVKEARAFQVTRAAPYEGEARQYRSFQVLSGDSAFAAQMMENAVDDLVRWRGRYAHYTEMWIKFGDCFQSVVNQIDEFREEATVVGLAADTDEGLARLLEWRTQFTDMLESWTKCREQVAYIMEAIGEAEGAFCKLKNVSTKRCISCGEDFVTLDEGMRTCPKCRQRLTYKTAGQRLPEAISSEAS